MHRTMKSSFSQPKIQRHVFWGLLWSVAVKVLTTWGHGMFQEPVGLAINNTITPDLCCSTCLDQTSIRGVDAVDFSKCSAAKTPCCFDNQCRSGTFTDFMLAPSTVEFVKGKATIQSGTWLALTWSSVEKVTYVMIVKGQPKTTQPKYNNGQSATKKDGFFQICAEAAGVLYLRGFRDGGCSASLEYDIQVVEGKGNTCSKVPLLPVTGDIECNLVRGSIQNGECVCASDHTGPPDCNGMPLWKWLVPVVGALAGVLSIAVSIHAFFQRKKRMKENRDSVMVASPRKSMTSFSSDINTSNRSYGPPPLRPQYVGPAPTRLAPTASPTEYTF